MIAIPGVVALLGVLFVVNFIGRSFTPILPLHLARPRLAAVAARLGDGRPDLGLLARGGHLGLGPRPPEPHPRAASGCCSRRSWAAPLIVAPMALVPSFELMLALAVLLGLVGGGSLTLCYTIGGLMVPQEVRTTSFGFFSGAALFGGALSPTVAGLVAHASLRGIYFVDAALYVLLALALARRAERCGRRPGCRLE